MHFSKVLGEAMLKVSITKVVDVFQYEPLDTSQKSIVRTPICSGMGATNLIFKARTDLRSVTTTGKKFITATIFVNCHLNHV